MVTSGMSLPRYCTTGFSFEYSTRSSSISSSRAMSASGTAFGPSLPARKRDERQQAVAQTEDRRVVDLLDPVLRVRRRADELDDADLRDGEFLAGAFDDERRNDGQGERDLDDERRALAFLALQLDRA